MVLYCDGIVAGNNNRADKGRAAEAIYWTFQEVPEWMRSSLIGWFYFGSLSEPVCDKLEYKLSTLMQAVIKVRKFAGAVDGKVLTACIRPTSSMPRLPPPANTKCFLTT